jgi:SAM-dependent methyltransferase
MTDATDLRTTLRFHEISERDNRILNPITEAQLMLLGELCRIKPGMRQLDLCCGKGEMLCRWSQAFGLAGTGVDISSVFLDAARARALELGVRDNVTFVQADAARYESQRGGFDIVSCIGATWIGGGLAGTLELMRPALRNADSLLLVGEPFWADDTPSAAYDAIVDGDRDLFTTLARTHDRLREAGFELIEMVLANLDGWDRYAAPQWRAASDWLRENSAAPEADTIRSMHEKARADHLAFTRRYLGWGVFVLRRG